MSEGTGRKPHALLPFHPTLRAAAVADVTPGFLQERGLRGLILDLDNTLVPWHGRDVPGQVEEWVRQMHCAGVQLCVVSNTHRPRRLRELAAVLGVGYVPSGGKPRRRGFLRALEAMGLPADQVAVLGDQVMTDIWGGNRCGLLTILVDPLSDVEFIGTRWISRKVERLILRLLASAGYTSPYLRRGTEGGEA